MAALVRLRARRGGFARRGTGRTALGAALGAAPWCCSARRGFARRGTWLHWALDSVRLRSQWLRSVRLHLGAGCARRRRGSAAGGGVTGTEAGAAAAGAGAGAAVTTSGSCGITSGVAAAAGDAPGADDVADTTPLAPLQMPPEVPKPPQAPLHLQQSRRGAREVSVCAGEPGCHAALAAA